MPLVNLIILGIVIGSNNFAVALALGALGLSAYRYRVIVVFGVFEFVVPLLGIWVGFAAAETIGLHSNIVGGILIFALGLFVVFGGFNHSSNDKLLAQRVTRWSGLIVLAAGLSLDNLMVGFSLGLGEARPLAVASAISLFSMLFTWLGMHFGSESRRRWEGTAEITAGVLLMVLGIASGAGHL